MMAAFVVQKVVEHILDRASSTRQDFETVWQVMIKVQHCGMRWSVYVLYYWYRRNGLKGEEEEE